MFSQIETHPSTELLKPKLNYLKYIGKFGALVAGVSLSFIGPPENAYAADLGGYPWKDASTVPRPPAMDDITWGYIDKSTCDNKSPEYDCSLATLGNNPKWFFRDQWGYDLMNCTSYVAWRVAKEFGKDVSGWGNADTWDTGAANAGYTVDNTPEPGDIAQWDSMHVAFVESVNPDGTANISQYNKSLKGEPSSQNSVRADHYIDINGEGVSLNGTGNTSSSPVSYAQVPDSKEFYTPEGWIYTKVGGAAFPIKNQGWTAADDVKWGGKPMGPVSVAEAHDHEAGYSDNGRIIGAHPPRNGTDVYVDGDPQQYYFLDGRAYPIGPGELDDLGVRDKAAMLPNYGRLSDFTTLGLIHLPNRSLYRFAGSPRVNLWSDHPDRSADAYHVNNDTVLDCLQITEGQPLRILPQILRYYLYDSAGRNIPELNQPAACAFPPQVVANGPGGQEQWRITGDNSSQGYVRHYYPNALLTYLHTSGRPDFRTLRSVAAINGVPQGADMQPPNGQFFRNASSGQTFDTVGNQYRPVLWPDMLACLGATSIIDVPSAAMIAMPQGPPMSCEFTNRLIYGPNGQQFYINHGSREPVPNPAVSACIAVRRGAGSPVQVSYDAINTYPTDGRNAWCNYEGEAGLNFAHEVGSGTVWLFEAGGTKRHVGSLCVGDAFTTSIKKYHVFELPAGETAGHVVGSDWFASTQNCNALPG